MRCLALLAIWMALPGCSASVQQLSAKLPDEGPAELSLLCARWNWLDLRNGGWQQECGFGVSSEAYQDPMSQQFGKWLDTLTETAGSLGTSLLLKQGLEAAGGLFRSGELDAVRERFESLPSEAPPVPLPE